MYQDLRVETFGREYFKTGNYTNYLKRKYDRQALDLTTIGFEKDDVIIDFGCATGGLLDGLQKIGFEYLIGTDISNWAIEKGKKLHPNVKLHYYNRNLLTWKKKSWIIMLDVMEHMDDDELKNSLVLLRDHPPSKGIIVRVPVCNREGSDYVREESRKDKTHVQCHTKKWWTDLFLLAGYSFKLLNLRSIYDSEGVLAGVLKHEKKT